MDWFDHFFGNKPQWNSWDDMGFLEKMLDLPAQWLQNSSEKNKDPQNWSVDDNPITDWLYGDWNEEKYKQYIALSIVPIVSDYMDAMLDLRADNEYLKRYGLSYDDIHDPRKLRTTGSYGRFLSGGMNFVSSNVSKLYR